MATYSLIRRSTNKQEFSVDRQKHLITEFAVANDIAIDHFFVEPPVSGKSPLSKRPVLLEAITRLRRNDTLIVLNTSRLAREAYIFYEIAFAIRKRQANLVFADGSPSNLFSDNPLDKFMAEMFASIASLERATIANRVQTGMEAARRKGVALGRPDRIRYGYANEDGKLIPRLDEMAVIEQAVQLRQLGYSYRQVADELNETGRRNRIGNPFSKQLVRNIFVQRAKDQV
jgi:DNA invertase Pin-like site-specific DNA recombinase